MKKHSEDLASVSSPESAREPEYVQYRALATNFFLETTYQGRLVALMP